MVLQAVNCSSPPRCGDWAQGSCLRTHSAALWLSLCACWYCCAPGQLQVVRLPQTARHTNYKQHQMQGTRNARNTYCKKHPTKPPCPAARLSAIFMLHQPCLQAIQS
jgi:hypothetical protein